MTKWQSQITQKFLGIFLQSLSINDVCEEHITINNGILYTIGKNRSLQSNVQSFDRISLLSTQVTNFCVLMLFNRNIIVVYHISCQRGNDYVYTHKVRNQNMDNFLNFFCLISPILGGKCDKFKFPWLVQLKFSEIKDQEKKQKKKIYDLLYAETKPKK